VGRSWRVTATGPGADVRGPRPCRRSTGLHVNAVSLSPNGPVPCSSIRHHDWVNQDRLPHGAGDVHIIWRLGQGDSPSAPRTRTLGFCSPAPSATSSRHTLIPRQRHPGAPATPALNSRGQVWRSMNESLTAILVVNADLGSAPAPRGRPADSSTELFLSNAGGQLPDPPTPACPHRRVTSYCNTHGLIPPGQQGGYPLETVCGPLYEGRMTRWRSTPEGGERSYQRRCVAACRFSI